MSKNTILLLVIAILGYHFYDIAHRQNPESVTAVVVPTPNVPQPPSLNIHQIKNTILAEDAKLIVEKLSSKDFGGRGIATAGEHQAISFITQYLDDLKIPYVKQEFVAKGMKTCNIIGYIQPTTAKNSDIIVIGAHFDHLGIRGSSYYPGADDNASGTAALMCLAKAINLYKNQLKYTISLQFYGAEEIGLLGSKYYINNPILPLENPDINKHIAMINLDMIGYLKNSYQNLENTTYYKSDKSWKVYQYSTMFSLKNIVDSLSDDYPFAKNISGFRPGGSDHAPFFHKGIPIVFVHTGSHPYYHTTSDTPDRLNYIGIERITKFVFDIILKINN